MWLETNDDKLWTPRTRNMILFISSKDLELLNLQEVCLSVNDFHCWMYDVQQLLNAWTWLLYSRSVNLVEFQNRKVTMVKGPLIGST